jgi:hypothetical protein
MTRGIHNFREVTTCCSCKFNNPDAGGFAANEAHSGYRDDFSNGPLLHHGECID